jgi:hypothetical protein
MTYQRDPDRRRPSDYMRRDDGSWSIVPIVLGLALILGLGYLVFGADWNSQPGTGTKTTESGPPPAPQSTPTTPTPAPKQ